MAQATEKQVKELEKALTEQFFYLVQGARFRINLARMGDPNKPLSENKAFVAYTKVFEDLVNKWIKKEAGYEVQLLKKGIKGLIASGDLKTNDFYYAESLPKLEMLVKRFDAEKSTNGIGFIPLLIWAAVWLAGLYTAKQITDDLTTTTQEKEELLTTTANTCKELGLTNEQCNEMISQTQKEASEGSGLGDTVKTLGIVAVGGFLLLQLMKSNN